MKKVILLHVIVEIVGGLVLVFRPDMLMLSTSLDVSSASVIKLFGTLIFTFGLVSLLIYRQFSYKDWDKRVVMIFMGYHLLQALQSYSMHDQGVMTNLGAFSLHIALAFFFLVTFMMEREKFMQ